MIYIEIVNGKPTRSTRFLNIAVNYKNRIETTYSDYTCSNNKYVYDKASNSIIINPNFKSEQAQKEAARIALLNLTAADVERGLYKAKGIDFEDIIAQLEAMPLAEGQEPLVDIKALKIELKANNFYRGNPYINTIGQFLGLSTSQLDSFFETNDYRYLTTVTLTVNPTPSDATVTINGEVKSTVTVPYGTAVEYSVVAEGYLTQSGMAELTENTTLDIELVEEPVEEENVNNEVEDENTTDNSDISDEVDTAPDTAEKADADNAG